MPTAIQFLGGGYLPSFWSDTGLNDPTLMLGTGAILWLVLGSWRARRRTLALGGEVAPLGILLVRLALLTVVIAWLTYQFASGRPGTSFPVPGLLLVSLVLLYSFIAGRTILGRHVYAVGGNSQAARLSGVDTRRVTFLVMMNMSILAALAGLMFVGRATASGPFDGMGWELDAISAVFIGGAAVSGGVGTVIGAVIGGLVMAVLNNGLQLMGVGADWTQIIKGLVLLLAVAFDVYSKRQGRPSIMGLLMRQRPQPAQTEAVTPALLPAALSALLLVSLGAGLLWLTGNRPNTTADAASRATGFAPDSLIGVALPQKTSENWVLAQQLFQDGLAAAGFRFDVQFANGGVPEQQNQIQTLVPHT